jgi:hypothetical protein
VAVPLLALAPSNFDVVCASAANAAAAPIKVKAQTAAQAATEPIVEIRSLRMELLLV